MLWHHRYNNRWIRFSLSMIYQLLLIVCGAKYIRPPSMFPGNVKDGVPFDRALSALREVIRRLNRKTSASNSSLDCTDFERQCGMHISSHGPRIMDDCLPSEGGWGYVFGKNEVMGFDLCRRPQLARHHHCKSILFPSHVILAFPQSWRDVRIK